MLAMVRHSANCGTEADRLWDRGWGQQFARSLENASPACRATCSLEQQFSVALRYCIAVQKQPQPVQVLGMQAVDNGLTCRRPSYLASPLVTSFA